MIAACRLPSAVLRGLKIVELPIHFSDRVEGESKMSLKVQLESALMPFRLRHYLRRASASVGTSVTGRGDGSGSAEVPGS